jgi:hypothetical protein
MTVAFIGVKGWYFSGPYDHLPLPGSTHHDSIFTLKAILMRNTEALQRPGQLKTVLM